MSGRGLFDEGAHCRVVLEDCALSLTSSGYGASLLVLHRPSSAFSRFDVLRVDAGRSVSWTGYAEVGGERKVVACAPEGYRGVVAAIVAERAVAALKGLAKDSVSAEEVRIEPDAESKPEEVEE